MFQVARAVSLTVALAAFPAGAAFSQVASVDERFIAASCSGAGFSCAFTVNQTITRLRQAGIVGPALDRAIGRIAATVAQQAAPAASQAQRARIAEALSIAANNSTDPGQRAAISGFAETIISQPTGTPIEVPVLDFSPS